MRLYNRNRWISISVGPILLLFQVLKYDCEPSQFDDLEELPLDFQPRCVHVFGNLVLYMVN